MIFLKFFLFARSRIQNWRQNGPIWRKFKKKVELREVRGVPFFQVKATFGQYPKVSGFFFRMASLIEDDFQKYHFNQYHALTVTS